MIAEAHRMQEHDLQLMAQVKAKVSLENFLFKILRLCENEEVVAEAKVWLKFLDDNRNLMTEEYKAKENELRDQFKQWF